MFDCLARIDLSHLLLENQGCCWTVELNQVRLLNLSGMTSRRKNRHDNPGMCLPRPTLSLSAEAETISILVWRPCGEKHLGFRKKPEGALCS